MGQIFNILHKFKLCVYVQVFSTANKSQRQYHKCSFTETVSKRYFHSESITETALQIQYHLNSITRCLSCHISSLDGRRCGTGVFWTAGAGAATPPPPLLPPLLPPPLTTTATTTTTEIHPHPSLSFDHNNQRDGSL